MNPYLIVFIIAICSLFAGGIFGDLKIRIRYNSGYAVRGRFAATEAISVPLDRVDVLPLLERAMKQLGGKKVRRGSEGWYVTGWIGSFLSNTAALTEYQILATLHQETGYVLVMCRARPRMMWGLIGADRSGKYVDQLVREIRLLGPVHE
jgi:hypothetical protein